MSNPILAWHFLTKDLLPWEGRRRKPLYVGHLWKEKGPPVLCGHGLHASVHILDALCYAPGPVVCRVKVSGTVVYGGDKLVGTRRKILAMGDISTVLHTWACDVAEAVCREFRVTDECCWAALEVKRRWIRGEATDEELTAARNSIRTAAVAAAEDAASDAANDAAWGATKTPSWIAAKYTATTAAWTPVWGGLNEDLEKRVLQAIGSTEVTSQT